jgi:DAACS family dicarboxylate/amino acid:cation (Na+ or H+) symporter
LSAAGSPPLQARRVLVGLAAGAALGALLAGRDGGVVRYVIEPVGTIWLNLLLVMMLPLASTALILGILGLEPGQLVRVGGRTAALTLALTMLAVAIGLLAVGLVAPGRGVDPAALPQGSGVPALATDAVALVVEQFPSNIVAAASGRNLVPVLVFAALFGIALRSTAAPEGRGVEALVRGIYAVSSRATTLVLWLAPVGVAALTCRLTARGGLDALVPLGRFVAVVLGGLAVQMLVVYPAVLWLLRRRLPGPFFSGAKPAMAVAFSTASSAATLPAALEAAEQRLGVPSETARFVLTIGATGNQHGTALFEGVAVLFLAQLYGLDLSLSHQALVAAGAILGGIGTAGVPGGSLPVVTALCAAVGLPAEAIGVLVGVDRLLDMCRTTLNVVGDLLIAVCVAPASEG